MKTAVLGVALSLLLSVAVFAGQPTAADSSSSSSQTADDLKKEITEELKGVTGVVTCTWKDKTGNDPSKLTCGKKLLVSGDKVGVINVIGLPVDKKVRVWANAIDDKSQGTEYDFTYDCTDADHRPSLVVEVHKSRALVPTYGGIFGFRSNANAMREKQEKDGKADSTKAGKAEKQKKDGKADSTTAGKDDSTKKRLSLVLGSSAQEIEMGVEVGENDKPDFQAVSDQIEVVYERWGFETGGFVAISNLVDSELVTVPDPADKSKIQVVKSRKADRSAQETGIFLSLIPRNYPFLGLGLGLATSSGRNASIYLGPSIRFLGLGNRGLASFSAGLVDRQVKVFPDAIPGQSYAPDSTVLKGSFESRLGGYFLINLGFTFGQIGSSGDSSDSAKK
jgi:hypothetical protein